MRPLPRRQGYRIVQSILQLQKTDERLIWNWQKLILANKLRLCVNELKKPIMAVFLLHLFVRLSRTFLLERLSLKELAKSLRSMSSVFISLFTIWIFVCREKTRSHWHHKQRNQPRTEMSLMFLKVESEQRV